MADNEVLTEENDEPTELEILQEISSDIKYLIKCTIPNSVYVDWDYPTDEGE